jgi:electron transfer flavoprotein alpha subunit
MSATDILIFAEVHQDSITESTLELLGAGRKLAAEIGGDVVAVVLNDRGSQYASALGSADRILVIEDAQLAIFSPEAYLDVMEQVCRSESPRVVLMGSTSVGLDLAPALGARLEAPVVTGCQKVEAVQDAVSVTASFCGGKMLADVNIASSPAILTLLPGSYHPTEEAGRGELNAQPSPVALSDGAIQFEEMILPDMSDVDITQEEVLVCVGRGIQQEDNLELAEELAEALGGQVCASRPIVDQGWLPTTRQVGKSGMTVKPKLYIALGMSGAPEHIEGMQDSDLIIAINTDPTAPIYDVAHYGTQLDLLDLVPELLEALKEKKVAH